MELVKGSTTVVIVGEWNPAILSPNWIIHEAFEIPSNEQVPATLEFAAIPSLPPKITIRDIVFVPSHDRLILGVTDPVAELLELTEKTAIKILRKLPHTPIRAIGENLELREDQPTLDQLRLFQSADHPPQGLNHNDEVIGTSLTTTFQRGSCQVNITHALRNGILSLKFNFHYEASSALDAVQKIENTFARNFSEAIEFVKRFSPGFQHLPGGRE